MREWTCGFVMAIGLVAIPETAAAQTQADEPTVTEIGHVRTSHQALRAVIAKASEQSRTFRRMVDTINASDGIVYIEPGMCRHGVRACLVRVTSAGRYRSIFVKVDVTRTERKLMASIGHELRHAIEILGEPGVTDLASMYIFYKSNGGGRSHSAAALETEAAVMAGEAVESEIGLFRRVRYAEK